MRAYGTEHFKNTMISDYTNRMILDKSASLKLKVAKLVDVRRETSIFN